MRFSGLVNWQKIWHLVRTYLENFILAAAMWIHTTVQWRWLYKSKMNTFWEKKQYHCLTTWAIAVLLAIMCNTTGELMAWFWKSFADSEKLNDLQDFHWTWSSFRFPSVHILKLLCIFLIYNLCGIFIYTLKC